MAPASIGLPRGSRDLLPPAARRRGRLIRTLVETFDAWGYDQVVTPTVEYYDVLATGLSDADRRLCVRFIEAQSGDLVALRADLTPQIARLAAGHRGEAWPADAVTRLAYAADVVRQPAGDREQTEYHQAGVELIGDADPAADAELIALAYVALEATGLTGFRFDVSHRAVAGGVIDALDLDLQDEAELRRLLARKDRGSVEQLLRSAELGGGRDHRPRSAGPRGDAEASGAGRPGGEAEPPTAPRPGASGAGRPGGAAEPPTAHRALPEADITAAAALCDLYGDAALLPRARQLLHAEASVAGLDALEAVITTLRELHPEAAAAVDLDLGEVRGFDYYSGLRLRVWAPGADRPVLRGGRYDDLIGRYGEPAPATGFAIDLDALDTALPDMAPKDMPPGRVVAVHPEAPADGRLAAARRSAEARRHGERAWVQPSVELTRAQQLADFWGATGLTFIEPGGSAVNYRRAQAGWARE